ncbi:hypothetical protein RRG08_047359 [Elysia crispata]|uniref:Uncharacterized protein n=1 Tax=Elysia crispata TaxID=231223 RepID=A0AAE1B0K4_9GAST|nr:hypothetical protein RRG08_047359 [Elysia crispata]
MHTRVLYFRIPCNSIEIAAPVNQGILSRQVNDSQIQSRMPLYQIKDGHSLNRSTDMASEASDKMEGWTNQVLVYLALTLGLILLVKYLLSPRPPHNIPPFPAKPYPIMGHLPYFKNGLKKQLEKWTES